MRIEDYFFINGTYELVDGLYNVIGDVESVRKDEKKLPVKFGNVSGSFSCWNSDLVTLEGCPKRVGGNFNCSCNKLTSLEGAPQFVGGNFYCSDNKLKSLECCPTYIGGNFDCDDHLKSNIEYRKYLIMKKLRD